MRSAEAGVSGPAAAALTPARTSASRDSDRTGWRTRALQAAQLPANPHPLGQKRGDRAIDAIDVPRDAIASSPARGRVPGPFRALRVSMFPPKRKKPASLAGRGLLNLDVCAAQLRRLPLPDHAGHKSKTES
jgi:hypothetical protein